ncbi:TPA: hypothetical protein R9120_001595 [Campylobacter upsaliensis]|nr:hypothetical protein [Campylobacter upsaliensis]
MIITHPKYYTSEGEITADELIELIENNFHNGHFYENINDFIISIYTNNYNPFTDCDEMPTLLSFSNRYTYGVKELESKEGEIIEINKDNEFKSWQSLLNDFTNYINGWSYELRIENQLKGTLDYFSFTDLEKAVEFALPILNETSEARAS